MEGIKFFFLKLCYEILSSIVARILFERVGANKLLHRWLRRLSRSSKRQISALTKRELTSLEVVEVVDLSVISEDMKNRIVDLIDEYGCISRRNEKDPIYFTPLSVDLEKLFLALAPVLAEEVVRRLNPVYDDYRIACIVVLPVPRISKSKMTARFQIALEQCLSGLEIPIEYFTPAVVRGELGPGSIAKTKEKERILILQPSPMDDQYLNYCISYIIDYSMSEIAEILTLVDPINQLKSEGSSLPRERVLLKLNLNN